MNFENEAPIHSISIWKNDLYKMQLNAPVPIPIINGNDIEDLPAYLGQDFHGFLGNREMVKLLQNEKDGSYLVRNSKSSQGECHTLSLKFNNEIRHYKLYHDSMGLYIQDKRYDCVRSLVADGLVTMYLELWAPQTLQRLASANYEESPYMTLNKQRLRKMTKEIRLNNAKNLGQVPMLSQQILGPNFQKQEKKHMFKLTTFKGLNWCEMCANFLWGFTLQGNKCEDCGIIVHVKCSEKLPNDCIPDLKYMRGVFGKELTTLLTAHNAELPFVVTKCVAEVESRGLSSEGIYRLSGYAEEIDSIKTEFDKDGEKADLSHEKYHNINVIAGALKLYLRLLPIPLIKFDVHPLLLNAMQHKNNDLKLSSLSHALTNLPIEHYRTLKFLLDHLQRVSCHSAVNKMTAHNLGTVFAPTLIGSADPSGVVVIPDMTSDILLIETLISHYDQIFLH